MASTGTALWPGASTFPNTNVFPGQDFLPIVRFLLSTDDLSVNNPTYTDYYTRLRSYEVSRGRGSELDDFDAGSATVVVDDRDRTFDPNVNALIRPLNRGWLYVEWSGEVHDLFKGYATSYIESWDQSGIVDAVTTITFADEFLVLAANALSVTSPPRDTYGDLVLSDNPVGYWNFNEDATQIGLFQPTDVSTPDLTEAPEETGIEPLKRGDRRAFPAKPRKRP